MTPVPQRQNGAALIIALVLLLAMTVIAFSASRDSLLQVQMSANQRQKQIAFESAELTLRGAEEWLWGQMDGGRPIAQTSASCSPCNVLQSDAIDPLASGTWDPGNVGTGGNVRAGPELAAQSNALDIAERPGFYIEERQAVKWSPGLDSDNARTLQFYEISARATGEKTRVESIVQSTFVLLF